VELVIAMEFVREYWWLILIAAIAVAVAFTLLRPRQRVQLTDSVPRRPHMPASAREREGRGLAGEAAAATSDVTGELLNAQVHRKLSGGKDPADDLCLLKGVGPKFADVLRSLGFFRFEQLARLTPTEIDRLDSQLAAFRGRIARDRIVEQADYLARGDIDGFEQRFGSIS
jgi:predicted flap endonuclease-1-like 5' DNA nuclease